MEQSKNGDDLTLFNKFDEVLPTSEQIMHFYTYKHF